MSTAGAITQIGAYVRTASVLAWAGATTQGARVSLPRMLEAGANCLPAAQLFLALGALAFAALRDRGLTHPGGS